MGNFDGSDFFPCQVKWAYGIDFIHLNRGSTWIFVFVVKNVVKTLFQGSMNTVAHVHFNLPLPKKEGANVV